MEFKRHQIKLMQYITSKRIPNIIFHGESGSGKQYLVQWFLHQIYGDREQFKVNVMFVNCAHGKGIKFIREELKFFARTSVQCGQGVIFKTIVLLNADFLTVDAQSALRRCIELFSHNTRFFIIVENKNKLLNPIISRFCEINIYNESSSLHLQNKQRLFPTTNNITNELLFIDQQLPPTDELSCITIATDLYENGISALHLISWIEEKYVADLFTKSKWLLHFSKIKHEFRCEKLLMLYIMQVMFLSKTTETTRNTIHAKK